MLGKYLKALRENMSIEGNKEDFSLRAVAERWGKANSYLSDIENELIKNPKDENIIDLLVKGYNFTHSMAKDKVGEWKMIEAASKTANPSAVHQKVGQIINGGTIDTINNTFTF